MSVTRPHRLLLLLSLLLWALCAILPSFAKDGWYSPDDIYRVDVVIFTYITQPAPIRATDKAHDFAHINSLAYARSPTAIPSDKITEATWDFAVVLDQWEQLALAHTQGPFVGPRQPLQTQEIMLAYPVVERKLRYISKDFESTIARIKNASEHHVLLAQQWHQPLPRGGHSAKWRMASGQSMLAALAVASPWFQDPTPPPGANFLDGTIALKRDQFFRASIELWWQQTSSQSHGPLQAAFLYPSGTWLSPLLAERVIPLNQWVYFDSERLGALIRVQPLN